MTAVASGTPLQNNGYRTGSPWSPSLRFEHLVSCYNRTGSPGDAATRTPAGVGSTGAGSGATAASPRMAGVAGMPMARCCKTTGAGPGHHGPNLNDDRNHHVQTEPSSRRDADREQASSSWDRRWNQQVDRNWTSGWHGSDTTWNREVAAHKERGCAAGGGYREAPQPWCPSTPIGRDWQAFRAPQEGRAPSGASAGQVQGRAEAEHHHENPSRVYGNDTGGSWPGTAREAVATAASPALRAPPPRRSIYGSLSDAFSGIRVAASDTDFDSASKLASRPAARTVRPPTKRHGATRALAGAASAPVQWRDLERSEANLERGARVRIPDGRAGTIMWHGRDTGKWGVDLDDGSKFAFQRHHLQLLQACTAFRGGAAGGSRAPGHRTPPVGGRWASKAADPPPRRRRRRRRKNGAAANNESAVDQDDLTVDPAVANVGDGKELSYVQEQSAAPRREEPERFELTTTDEECSGDDDYDDFFPDLQTVEAVTQETQKVIQEARAAWVDLAADDAVEDTPVAPTKGVAVAGGTSTSMPRHDSGLAVGFPLAGVSNAL